MGFDKNTKAIIRFVRKMQATGRYKKNVWKVKPREVKVDNRKIYALDNIK